MFLFRGINDLQQFIQDSKNANHMFSPKGCPTTPKKELNGGSKTLSPLSTPIKTPLKCKKCDMRLTGDHHCSPSKDKQLFQQLSPSKIQISPKPKIQLSPLKKRSFDTWSESEAESSEAADQALSPYHRNEINDGMQMGLFAGENEHEIITLPTYIKPTNKIAKDSTRRKGKRLSLQKQKSWSAMSFTENGDSMKSSKKTEPKTMESVSFQIGKLDKMKPLGHIRANSWSGFSLDPNQCSPQRDYNPFFQQSALCIKPEFQRSNSFGSDYSDTATTVASIESYIDEMELMSIDATGTNTQTQTKVTGCGICDIDADIAEMDLTSVVLDINDNNNDWQSLLIVTPTSRNRPETRGKKPVIVSETVFEEEEENLAEPLKIDQVKSNETSWVIPTNKGFDLSSLRINTDFNMEVNRHLNVINSLTSPSAKRIASIIDEGIINEMSSQSIDAYMVSFDMMDEDDEVFRYLNENLCS
jgi:hypothetical protein